MENVSDSLREGEQVIVTAKVHLGALVLPVILLVAGIAVVYFGAGPSTGWFRVVGIIVGLVGLWKTANTIMHLVATRLTVTDQRLFGESGLFPRKRMTLALSDVDSVDAKHDVLGAMMGYGTLVVNATGKGNLRVEYRQIVNATQIAEKIRAQMALPTVRPTAEKGTHPQSA